jgi:hypothetical protein
VLRLRQAGTMAARWMANEAVLAHGHYWRFKFPCVVFLEIVNKYLCRNLYAGVRLGVSPVRQFQAK